MLVVTVFHLSEPDADSTPYSAQDVVEAVEARLDETYPTFDGYPALPERVRTVVLSESAFAALVSSAEVGLDGAADEDAGADSAYVVAADEAYAALDTLRGLNVD